MRRIEESLSPLGDGRAKAEVDRKDAGASGEIGKVLTVHTVLTVLTDSRSNSLPPTLTSEGLLSLPVFDLEEFGDLRHFSTTPTARMARTTTLPAPKSLWQV